MLNLFKKKSSQKQNHKAKQQKQDDCPMCKVSDEIIQSLKQETEPNNHQNSKCCKG